MQVQSYDLRDMKRAARKRRRGYECAPDIGLGFQVGANVTFGNQFLNQSPPVTSGLTHWYKTGRTLLQASLAAAVTSGSNDAVAPAQIVTESPFGTARRVTATATAGPHGFSRAITAETNTLVTIQMWVRRADNVLDASWVFLGFGAGPQGAWFNTFTGAIGTIVGGGVPRVVQTYFEPISGNPWFLLEYADANYSGGGPVVVYMSNADNTSTYTAAGTERVTYDPPTLTQDKVTQWTDLIGTDHLLQATVNVKPLWLAGSPQFQGEPSLRFTSSHFVQASTAASWANLHDGTGSSFAVVFRNPQTGAGYDNIITTNGNSSTATGMSLTYRGDLRRIVWEVGGGGSTKHALTCDFPSALVGAQAHWCGGSLAGVNNPDAELWVDGSKISTSNPSGGYTAGAPLQALVVGGAASGVVAEIAELLTWNRALTAAEWELTGYYLKSKHGTA